MSSRAMLIKAGGVYPLSFAGVRRLCCRETHIAHGRLCRGFLQYSNGTFNNFPFFQTNASSEKDGVAPVEQEVDESEKEFAALGVDPRLMVRIFPRMNINTFNSTLIFDIYIM